MSFVASEAGSHLSGISGFPQIARMAGRGNRLATLVSAFAFAFSAVSFYETVLKRPHLHVYVTDTLAYTRDPWGAYEVVAVPVTIANSGARDGAVITLELDVKNLDTGKVEVFTSAYTADAQYFAGTDDVARRIKRPKSPFAPLSITGRGSFAGTVLFYSPEGRDQKLIEPNSKVELTLRILMPAADGWLESLLATQPARIQLRAQVGNFLPGALLVGDMARLRLMQVSPPTRG
jgi:hypothetical protein